MTEEGPPPEEAYGDAAPFAPATPDPLLHRALPVAAELPSYGTGGARRDLVAGVTVAALAIPSAMAYAEVAGLPPINGLYALLLPPIAYALLGSSRQLIVGPEGSLSALIAVSVLATATAGSAHAAELADQQHDRDAVDVAHEDWAREVVRDPADPQQPRQAVERRDEQREHGGQLGGVCAPSGRRRQDGYGDQRGQRALRPDDQLA